MKWQVCFYSLSLHHYKLMVSVSVSVCKGFMGFFFLLFLCSGLGISLVMQFVCRISLPMGSFDVSFRLVWL